MTKFALILIAIVAVVAGLFAYQEQARAWLTAKRLAWLGRGADNPEIDEPYAATLKPADQDARDKGAV